MTSWKYHIETLNETRDHEMAQARRHKASGDPAQLKRVKYRVMEARRYNHMAVKAAKFWSDERTAARALAAEARAEAKGATEPCTPPARTPKRRKSG